MITISTDKIAVDILDPIADRDKLGSRYCTGGYIWQLYGRDGRPLLSGPHFPSASPPVFDGQGMPEVFETPLGGEGGAVGSNVCVIGVGLVKKSSGIAPFHPRNNPHVARFCDWDIIERESDRVAMVTSQTFGGKSVKLRRMVRVEGNRVESINTLANTGGSDVNLRWFSHPFFPPTANLSCGKIAPRIKLPDNAGYEMGADGVISMKPDYPWEKGLFQVLDTPEAKLNFHILHPAAGALNLQLDYNVTRCALWANSRAFSFEPFTQRTVSARGEASWGVALAL
ncbi:MAG: hypothetical protein LBH93_02120 [Chitinispirillales bacterium]|jgi:hypothetical protein|nr:hypothetical protein [Chitinispirillales bacterium]